MLFRDLAVSTIRSSKSLLASLFALIALASPIFAEPTRLMPPDLESGDRFGWATAVAGDRLCVGAAFDDLGDEDVGSVYAFRRRATGPDLWDQTQKLVDPQPAAGDENGFALDIDGDTLVSGVEDDAGVLGAVLIYGWLDEGWRFERRIAASDPEVEDSFGVALDLQGDLLAVGSLRGILREEPPPTGNRAGVAYIFERHWTGPNRWGQVARLSADDGQFGDSFGQSVAASADLVAVGAPGTVERGDSGAVYLYRRDSGGADTWGQVQKLTPLGSAGGDRFGWSMTFDESGTRLFIGAPGADELGIDAGAVYVFERNESGLFEQIKHLQVGDTGDELGFSLSVGGPFLLVGSPFADQDFAPNTQVIDAGAVHLFEAQDDFRHLRTLQAPDASAGASFGFAVSTDGVSAIVGAPFRNANAPELGAAYSYRLATEQSEFCVSDDAERHCLLGGRFELSLTWRDFEGNTGTGKSVPGATDLAGLFWFFEATNWEIQVKMINGCDFNDHFWLFAGSTTNVEYVLSARDIVSGQVRTYANGLGISAPAITDTSVFATCP